MLLEIENLGVEVAGKRVLKNVNLSIEEGETHVLLGPNGAGKSTLFLTILGFPQYNVVQGSIKFKGQDIIVTDGNTLLGADDKAGIAEILTAMEYLINHPEIPH